MIIGDKSTFAIEWDSISAFDGFVYGHFRFWIEGEPVGDWAEKVVLGVLTCSATVFLKFKGRRHIPDSECMDAERLWNFIYHYANSLDPAEMKVALEGNFRTGFFVHDIADDSVATQCEMILVDQESGDQRLLWKPRGSTQVRETRYQSMLVDVVIEEFLWQVAS